MSLSDAELRAYLLGRTAGADAERLEARLLEDEDAFMACRSVEDDLFDDFAGNRLNAGERALFLERYGDQAARLTFARALARRTAAGARPNASIPRRWLPLAAAATLVIAAAGWLVLRDSPRQQVIEPPRSTVPTPAPVLATVMLTLGTSRSAGAPSIVQIGRDVSAVVLRIRLDPADRFDRYALELRSTADRIVWQAGEVRAAAAETELTVSAQVPSSAMLDGDYELAVRGVRADGSLEALGFVTVKLTRTP